MKTSAAFFFQGEGLAIGTAVYNGIPCIKFEQGYTSPLAIYMDLAQMRMLARNIDRFVELQEANAECAKT